MKNTSERIEEIVKSYAHDYRNMAMDYDHFRAFLLEFLEAIEEAKGKYKYTRKQAIELIRCDWNFEIMKNVLLAKEQGEKKHIHYRNAGETTCETCGKELIYPTPPLKEPSIYKSKVYKDFIQELSKPPKIKVIAQTEDDKEKAKLMQKLINYQFETNQNNIVGKYFRIMRMVQDEFIKSQVYGTKKKQ